MRLATVVSVVAWSVLLATTGVSGDATPSVTLSGRVRGASGRHSVYVALWNSENFLERPSQSLRLDVDGPVVYRFQTPPGRWAVSAFEDRNDNGVLDAGRFGPKEPSGFWKPFRGWRRPRFDDVAVTVDHDVVDADIDLR